jgi:hypothetical protein
MRHMNTGLHAGVRNKVHEALKSTHGMSRRFLFRKLGITRPEDEGQRERVWLASAAIAKLRRDGMIDAYMNDGELLYHLRGA